MLPAAYCRFLRPPWLSGQRPIFRGDRPDDPRYTSAEPFMLEPVPLVTLRDIRLDHPNHQPTD